MGLRGIVVTVAVLTVVALACASAIGRADNPAQTVAARTAQRWEYKAVQLTLGDADSQQKMLNELGASEWELVTTQINPVPSQSGGAVVYLALLKRPKP